MTHPDQIISALRALRLATDPAGLALLEQIIRDVQRLPMPQRTRVKVAPWTTEEASR